jgi:site-specific DNA recombinase
MLGPTGSLSGKMIDGYIRVSRVGDRRGGSFVSPKIQRAALTTWANDHGARLKIQPSELNVSGHSMDRPILNRILERIRCGESDGIVVYRLDRLARNLLGGLALLEELQRNNAVVASATEPAFDFTTPTGSMFLSIHLMIAEYFRDQARESIKSALQAAVARGVHISAVTAFGYDKGPDKRLVPNSHAPVAKQIFERRAARWSYARIAAWLVEQGSIRPNGRPWTWKAVCILLHQRVYLGVAHWGTCSNPNAHAPIVDEDLWVRAQHASAHKVKRVLDEDDVGIVHGLVRCSGCSQPMTRADSGPGAGQKRLHHYYICTRGRRRHDPCTAPSRIRAGGRDGLDAFVESCLFEQLRRRGSSEEVLEAMGQLEAAVDALRGLDHDLLATERLSSQKERIVASHQQAVETSEDRIRDLIGGPLGPITTIELHDYQAHTRAERRHLLPRLIECVVVRGTIGRHGGHLATFVPGNVEIVWRGSASRSLPRGPGAVPWTP